MLRLPIFLFLSSLLFSSTTLSEQSNGAQTLKRKVAIARFSNETRSGQSFMRDESGDRLGKQASDILSARLSSTGSFLMFERSDSTKISAEQMLAGLKESGVAVDYLILGSVSEFGRSVESVSGVFSRAKAQRAYAKVNVRLVDVETGRIVHSAEGAGEAVSETKKKYVASNQQWRCNDCQNQLDHTFEVDHIKDLRFGGDNSVDNLVALY